MKDRLKKLVEKYGCKVVLVSIQVLFLGGGHMYVNELQALRQEINTQSEKIQKEVVKAEEALNGAKESGDRVVRQLENIKKACGRFL